MKSRIDFRQGTLSYSDQSLGAAPKFQVVFSFLLGICILSDKIEEKSVDDDETSADNSHKLLAMRDGSFSRPTRMIKSDTDRAPITIIPSSVACMPRDSKLLLHGITTSMWSGPSVFASMNSAPC